MLVYKGRGKKYVTCLAQRIKSRALISQEKVKASGILSECGNGRNNCASPEEMEGILNFTNRICRVSGNLIKTFCANSTKRVLFPIRASRITARICVTTVESIFQ